MTVAAPTDAVRKIAAFDFDGTISRRDCLVPFLAILVGWPRLVYCFVANLRALIGRFRGVVTYDEYKAILLRSLLLGIDADRFLESADRYSKRICRRKLRPDTLERIRQHQNLGHEVVIISASLAAYLRPVGAELGLDAVLAVELETDVSTNTLTGEMLGGNVRGAAKVDRLESFIGADRAETWAYGDGAGDQKMFEFVDHPIWLRPVGVGAR